MRRTVLALLVSTLSAASAFAGTWYVAPPANGGNDNNSGTSTAAPFATITKGVSMLEDPGDILYVRAGTYNEFVTIWYKTGTDADPIRIMPYDGETVIIDAAGLTWSGDPPPVVAIGESEYIRFDDFDVRNGPEAGIRVYDAHHIRVRWNDVHGNQKFGIVATSASASTRGTTHDIIIEGNDVYDNVLNNSSRNSSSGWTQGIGTYRIDDVQIVDNYVYENYGEGIDCVLTDGCTTARNTLWDNFGTNIYLDNATNAVVDRNFCMAGRAEHPENYTRDGYGARGISTANEHYVVNGVHESNPLNNLTITNNITVNGKFGFVYGDYDDGGGLHNTLIANNTFYGGEDMCVYIENPAGSDVTDTTTIRNNIFYAATGQEYVYTTTTGVAWGYNTWYNGTANTHKSGSGDVHDDPDLVQPGGSDKTDYQLLSSSPCRNTGTTITAVTTDYWGTSRGATAYDIGAHEYN